MDSTDQTPSPDPAPSLPSPAEEPAEKGALRIQAAAVAAQQAALAEEEARLQQQRVALEQQEKQLAAHLEDKRQQLLQLQEQARRAQAEIQRQRQSFEERVAAVHRELARQRRELAEDRRGTRAERNRLHDLRRSLKHRWHRHWAAERQAQQRREADLAGQRRRLEQEREQVRCQQAALVQARLGFNGWRELGRRQLQDAWGRLRQAEQHWQERQAREKAEVQGRCRQLDHRAAELARAGQELEEEKRHWQGLRFHLEKEADGLENRIRNHRSKLRDQEQEVIRLDAIIRTKTAAVTGEPGIAKPADAPVIPASAPAPPASPEVERWALQLREEEADVLGRPETLERLADDLADQRLHLAEQGEWLLQTRQQWQQDHDAAASELEMMDRCLQERERAIAARERALESAEGRLRRRLDEVVYLRDNLEGCRARFRMRVVAWEAERDRLLIEVRGRETRADRRWRAVAVIRGRLENHRRLELARLQAGLAASEQCRQEYANLREGSLRRSAALDQQERNLAARSLALEEYRQECVGQSADSPGAEKRLEQLRRHWIVLAEDADRAVARQQEALRAEAARLEARSRQVHRLAQEAAAQVAKLADEQTSREHDQALLNDRHHQLREEMKRLDSQLQRDQRQLEELREEVERIARMLLDEEEPAVLPALSQAA
jgi:hypothetical protein